MRNIIDIVRSNRDTFFERPFSAVDSLILSQLVNLNFDRFVHPPIPLSDPDGRGLTLLELAQVADTDTLFEAVWHRKNVRELFEASIQNPRFRDIELRNFVHHKDVSQEKQFAACTFMLGDNSAYISFRGTDESFVGWKEDFNMAFITPVPSQEEGVAYLDTVADFVTGPLRLGGHSKGGNISVYAATFCKERVQSRIVEVYNHDGPGFRADIYEQVAYRRIQDRIDKTMPQSSVVGMLLENQDSYRVVKNIHPWFMQHNPYTWELEGTDFSCISELSKQAQNRSRAVSTWLAGMTTADRKRYVNTLYEIIMATEASGFQDLSEDWLQRGKTLVQAMKGIDEDSKYFLKDTLRSFFLHQRGENP